MILLYFLLTVIMFSLIKIAILLAQFIKQIKQKRLKKSEWREFEMKCTHCSSKRNLVPMRLLTEEVFLCEKCRKFVLKVGQDGVTVEELMDFLKKIKKNIEKDKELNK